MDHALELVRVVREIKHDFDLKRHHHPDLTIVTSNNDLASYAHIIQTLAQVDKISFSEEPGKGLSCKLEATDCDIDLFVDVKDLVDNQSCITKLEKSREKLSAKPKKTAETKGEEQKDLEKAKETERRLQTLNQRIDFLRAMQNVN